MELSIAPVVRVMKGAGAERISRDAKEYLAKELEAYATEVATEAIRLAQHAGRKTVMEEDIKLAAKRV